jgi:hypothetical protein
MLGHVAALDWRRHNKDKDCGCGAVPFFGSQRSTILVALMTIGSPGGSAGVGEDVGAVVC